MKVIIKCDINIDLQYRTHPGFGNFKESGIVFGLENLAKAKTCFTGDHSSPIDVILKSRKQNYEKISAFENGSSDCNSLHSPHKANNVCL